jgi:hypothetical protein
VGIGENNSEVNPFFARNFRFLKEYFGKVPHLDDPRIHKNDAYLFPVDANMGVDGLPQSGTGQTSIFAGFNAPKYIGKHFGPYPYSTLLPLLKEENIFRAFLDKRLKVTFANAYPKMFFDYINSGRRRLSVTSLSCIYSGVPLKDYKALLNGEGLSAEIDNSRWVNKLGYDLPIISPEKAGDNLLKLASHNNFTLFEFFLTDHFGHRRHMDVKEHFLKVLDDFLIYIFQNLPKSMTLVVCSDHGNLEDSTSKTHTRNPALTITAGKYSFELSKKIKYLYDIKPAIMELYN